MPEFIDPVFTKTSPKRSFSVIQNERFGLVFAKTGSIILGTEDGLYEKPFFLFVGELLFHKIDLEPFGMRNPSSKEGGLGTYENKPSSKN